MPPQSRDGGSWRRAALFAGRALRRRCPNCGGGPVWQNWFRMRASCPVCGLPLDRGESDHFYGAYMFNWIAAELAVAIAFVIALVITWPTPPWDALTYGTVIVAVLAPIALYPVSKGLWLAVDLVFRPYRQNEEA